MNHRPCFSAVRDIALGCVIVFASQALAAEPAPATTPEVEKRVESLLSQLTLDEELSLLYGDGNMGTHAVDRLKIPAIKFSDASVGVRCWGPSTAYPATVALAATWDAELSGAMGVALGRDARARGVHVLLGPGMNIARQPQGGRNFEYLGEDPYLASVMAVGFVKGVQSQGVAACIKHFIGNEQEEGRNSWSSDIDPRTLHEIYLPPFKACVQQGGAWTLMNAYNKLNGVYCSENALILNQILKTEWGFNGMVMSDWGSTHSLIGCMNGGLDLEMPKDDVYKTVEIKSLLASGEIQKATIDEHVRRLLRVMVAMKFLDRPQQDDSIPKVDLASAAVAYKVAAEGTVLLKNAGHILPLDTARIHKILVIGPHAVKAVTGGEGSSYTKSNVPSVSVAAAVAAVGGKGVTVETVPWEGMTLSGAKSVYEAIDGQVGLKATYFDNKYLRGEPVLTRQDAQVDFNWKSGTPAAEVKGKSFSVRWEGKIKAPKTGDYLFAINSDDGGRVFVDGKEVLNTWWDHETVRRTTRVSLAADAVHDLRVEYFNSGGLAEVQFGWEAAKPLISDELAAKLTDADAVIACVGYSPSEGYEGEGSDRTWLLPPGQDAFLKAVVAANAKTIVVLNAGGSVDMRSWLDHAAALVHAWYPGENGNTAVADILFGKRNPSGKLPTTFEKRWEDAAAFGNFPGRDQHVTFAEGLFVGYRWFDQKKIEPAFPFGFGLSYTTFTISRAETKREGGKATVSFDVTNTGAVAGATVAQVYVRPAPAPVERPDHELKGFARVELAAGETRRVSVGLDATSLAYFEVGSNSWKTPAGRYQVAIGLSSREIEQTVDLDWK